MQPDFYNLYTNKSYLSRQQQVPLYHEIVKILAEQVKEKQEYFMLLELHGLLFSILSETAFNEVVFFAGSDVSSQLISAYSEQLRPDNILAVTELDDRTDYQSKEFTSVLEEYFQMLGQEVGKLFSIMVLPYKMLETGYEQKLKTIYNLTAYQGRIILYDCPKSIPKLDLFRRDEIFDIDSQQTITILTTIREFEASAVYEKCMGEIEQFQRQVIRFLEGREYQRVERLIVEAQQVENMVVKHYDELLQEDLKYHINEIKNSLLNIYYAEERDIEFFVQEIYKLIYT